MKSAIVVGVSLVLCFACAAPRATEPAAFSAEVQSLARELELVEEALRKVESRLGHLQSELAAASPKDEFTVMVLDAVGRPRELGFDASTSGDDVFYCHPTEWRGFGKMKRFTQLADPVFYLEAEGRGAIQAHMAEGGVSSSDGSTRYVVLSANGPLVPGVTYRLRPRNDNERYRWSLEGELAVTLPVSAP
jgi:hypothetical protein